MVAINPCHTRPRECLRLTWAAIVGARVNLPTIRDQRIILPHVPAWAGGHAATAKGEPNRLQWTQR